MKQFTFDGFKVVIDDYGCVLLTSPTGRTYEVLEGRGIGGRVTSDIAFIMETDEEEGYTNFVNYTFGADFTSKDRLPGCIEYCVGYINDYEKLN